MAGPQDWLKNFRLLHEQARGGKMSDRDRGDYFASREQLARSLMAAQNLTLEDGKTARKSFRVAQTMQVTLQFAKGDVRSATQDISVGGFSVMLQQPPDEKEQPGFSLRMPGGVDPIIGRVRVASVTKRVGTCRVSFNFVDLPEKDQERLETALFDLVLQRLP